MAKNRFGAAKRWTASGLSGFRADGSVRDDGYNNGLMESLAHADELTQLSDEELELAMKTFKKFDRDRDGKLLPDEMLAFWKHISFLTVKDHAGSLRDAGENEDDYMVDFDDDAVFETVEGDTEGAMNLSEFITVLSRFSAAEQALVDVDPGCDDDDVEYRTLLSQAAASLMICDDISPLPKHTLTKAIKLFEKADVKRRGSIRMAVAATRLGLDRADVPTSCDLDKNGVLDFNEFVKGVLPRIMPGAQLDKEAMLQEPTDESSRWPVTNRWNSGEYQSARSIDDVATGEYEAKALTNLATAMNKGGPLAHLSRHDVKDAIRTFRKFDKDGDFILHGDEMLAFWRHVTNIGVSSVAATSSITVSSDRAIVAHAGSLGGIGLASFIEMLERYAAAEKALTQRLDASRDDELEYRSMLVMSAPSLCLFDAISASTQDTMERALSAFKVADESRCGAVKFEMARVLFGVEISEGDDADGNVVIDFNEFMKFVMPRVDAKMRNQAQDKMSAARQARELRSNARRVQTEIRRGSVRDEADS